MSFLGFAVRASSWLVILCLLAACSQQTGEYHVDKQDGSASMGAISQTQYLLFSNTSQADITYRASTTQSNKAPLDVLLLFDRTASMKDVINTTASAAKSIVTEVQSIAPDTRFAVAAVSDYTPLFSDATDKRTWLLLSDFTYQANAVQSATEDINLVNGGDMPEAYVRGLYEASELAWRGDAKKIIIFFGDATSHSPDPGRDETFGTADDLQMDTVLSALKAKNIAVIGIHTREDAEVVAAFNTISNTTDGKSVSLDNASESASMIKNAITSALPDAPSLVTSSEFTGWISTANTGTGNPNKIDYSVNIHVPADTLAGVYAIPLTLTATEKTDPLMMAFNNKVFEIKIITGWYNHPLALWLPLLALLLCLLYSAIRMLKGGYAQSIHVTSKRHLKADAYSLMHLLIDLLVLASLVCCCTSIYLLLTGQVLSQIL